MIKASKDKILQLYEHNIINKHASVHQDKYNQDHEPLEVDSQKYINYNNNMQ